LQRKRLLAALVLMAGLSPGTWFRVIPPPPDYRLNLRATSITLPRATELARHLGPFRLEGAWTLESRHDWFGSYSALLTLPDGCLFAFSDRGYRLEFQPPGGSGNHFAEIGTIVNDPIQFKQARDAEAATRDPRTGSIWIAWEGQNAIQRFDAEGTSTGKVQPATMQHWGANQGPEAMLRLADGRFIALREGYDRLLDRKSHRAVLFSGDPVEGAKAAQFTFHGPKGFKPTDMAQLPDGRVLILLRKVVWPAPARFANRIAIADPADIVPGKVWRAQTVARLSSTLPVDNFEGMAIVPRGDGTVTVWLIADSNQAVLQSNVLWRLSVDPRRLPERDVRPRPIS
jgi:hypothetical protein